MKIQMVIRGFEEKSFKKFKFDVTMPGYKKLYVFNIYGIGLFFYI